MKKMLSYVLVILLFSCFTINVSYSSDLTDTLTKIENDLYGFDYSKDSSQNRILRLEKTVYGKASTGDLNKRIKRLSEDVSADVIGLEIPPVEDTFREDEIAADSTVNYPIVDEIEQKIFNQTYKSRDFHSRIVAIERKLFGKIYDVDDYSTRMDRIKAEVMPQTIAKENENFRGEFISPRYYDNDALMAEDLSGINRSRFGMPYGQRNYSRPYSNYGDFTGAASPIQQSTNLNDELAQLEYETFGTEFSNEDTAKRIKRLNSVNRAKKSSSKYDSNKFNQRMSTAMEIGAMILMILAMVL